MKDRSSSEAREARRQARKRRREERKVAREHRRMSIRTAMASHREFMLELSQHNQKIKRVNHPLASILMAHRDPVALSSAVKEYFDDLMCAATDAAARQE